MSLIAVIMARLVYIWTCQPRAFTRSTAGLQPRAADIGIVGAAGGEIEPDAAEAGLVHGVEVALRRLVVDHGDAAGVRAARLMPNWLAELSVP